MNYIVLDFDGIKSPWALHKYFKEVFNLPDYYGHNMDALWDCLDCSFESPTTIVLKNIERLPSEMEAEACPDHIHMLVGIPLWARGYYVDTVGRNKKQVTEYIRNQLQADQMADQIGLKEFVDPFTDRENKKT